LSEKWLSLGLTGYPLAHSFSPQLHEVALQACGLKGEYRLYPMHPDDPAGLGALLDNVRKGRLHGLNVTIPHKRSVLRFLDEVSETAMAIGAVNTIYVREGVLVGENTDADGFMADLERCKINSEKRELLAKGPQKALILGAGGSARAVTYALVRAGWQVCVAARRLEQAQALQQAISEKVEVIALESEALADRPVDLVVNTTPLGMGERAGESVWPAGVQLPDMAFIYDLVYNPAETALMRDAMQAGLRCVNGLGMLVEQARLAFRIWTGREVYREVMERAVWKN
jgi:shikimate dehydrogenase